MTSIKSAHSKPFSYITPPSFPQNYPAFSGSAKIKSAGFDASKNIQRTQTGAVQNANSHKHRLDFKA